MTVDLDAIDLQGLAEALDDQDWESDHYFDPATGELWFGGMDGILGADGAVIDPDEQGWVHVDGQGSRAAYRVTEDFAGRLADRALAERLLLAIEGKGAFRRFRDVLFREADEATTRAWRAFERARSEPRALDWLESHGGLTDASGLATGRAEREAVIATALAEIGTTTSGARLVLLNGMPGSGKSTLAERYRAEHPGVLCVEADVLRTWIGGDPTEHAEIARDLSLALCRTHLTAGYDVVVPQLVARLDQLERFEQVAEECGAELVEVVLHGGVVDSRVPDAAVDHLVEYAHGLADLVARRPDTHRLATRHGDVDSAYHALVDLLDPDLPA
jgi:predicted kinase